MADSYQEIFDFLDRLGDTLDELTEISKKKTAAVLRDDLLGVNECMKKEQVISLTLRTMDTQREKLMAAIGGAGRPLSALPELCPAERKAEAREIVDWLRDCYAIYRSAAEASRTTLEINLHQIEKLIAELPGDGEGRIADIRA